MSSEDQRRDHDEVPIIAMSEKEIEDSQHDDDLPQSRIRRQKSALGLEISPKFAKIAAIFIILYLLFDLIFYKSIRASSLNLTKQLQTHNVTSLFKAISWVLLTIETSPARFLLFVIIFVNSKIATCALITIQAVSGHAIFALLKVFYFRVRPFWVNDTINHSGVCQVTSGGPEIEIFYALVALYYSPMIFLVENNDQRTYQSSKYRIVRILSGVVIILISMMYVYQGNAFVGDILLSWVYSMLVFIAFAAFGQRYVKSAIMAITLKARKYWAIGVVIAGLLALVTGVIIWGVWMIQDVGDYFVFHEEWLSNMVIGCKSEGVAQRAYGLEADLLEMGSLWMVFGTMIGTAYLFAHYPGFENRWNSGLTFNQKTMIVFCYTFILMLIDFAVDICHHLPFFNHFLSRLAMEATGGFLTTFLIFGALFKALISFRVIEAPTSMHHVFEMSTMSLDDSF
eukprot:CAMPEP_0114976012 /NCGR_PEP_ID=MMETSP0216-20121206/2425_1 /TAXON_ID=223996 /ORGANISM="Protocruzia adherens, Strain Boccale" /LENGTH=454 /DNA_ID=CAMNT_0002336871 /DNA_START=13 /DNA_END=1377 /DNA_ORIENTATION=-